MAPTYDLTSLIILHSCGHSEPHSIPGELTLPVRERLEATLSGERCWRCIVSDAWDRLPPWSPMELLAS